MKDNKTTSGVWKTHQTLFRLQKHVPELIDLKNKTTTTDFSALGRFDINVM